ncbi:MAG: hypothetical protein AAFR87_31125 [Bacteroidota bacterium]
MRYLFYLLLFPLFFVLSCEENPQNSDLTTQIVGSYSGTVTLKIGSPDANDIENQSFLVEKIDDTSVRLTPQVYPNQSPIDSMSFTANLTITPLGFINTDGVMLTFNTEQFADGSVSGTPFSLNSVQQDAHGRYDEDTRELVFALEIVKDGVSDFEFFVGKRQ